MRKMIAVAAASLAAILILAPAVAAEREFDLGFAYPGMMQGQFRFGAWPPGTTVFCSDDPDLPKELGRQLYMPKQMQDLGGTRCALMAVDGDGHWKSATRKISGHPVEMSATFAPDQAGARRLLQLFLYLPREGYAAMVRHFVARFGPPATETERLVHWRTSRSEAVVMHEEGDQVMALLVNTQLQDAMNKKLDALTKRK